MRNINKQQSIFDKWILPALQLAALCILGIIITNLTVAIFRWNISLNWWESVLVGIVVGSVAFGMWQDFNSHNTDA